MERSGARVETKGENPGNKEFIDRNSQNQKKRPHKYAEIENKAHRKKAEKTSRAKFLVNTNPRKKKS